MVRKIVRPKIIPQEQIPPKTNQQLSYYEYLKTDTWTKKRLEVVMRDGRRCRVCNSSRSLHVHHRRYPKVHGDEHLSDLITLCKKCHALFHGKTKDRKQQHQKKLSRKQRKREKELARLIEEQGQEEQYVKVLSWIK